MTDCGNRPIRRGSTRMKFAEPDWGIISKLLDEVLDLPADLRIRWLDALGPPHAAFRETLRELLALHAAAETADFLNTVPKLHFVIADAGEVAEQGAPHQTVGPYRIIRELGRGGMGTVWLAARTDGILKRPVALKLPHSGLDSARLAERFARERNILAGLTHPNIARLYDAGVTEAGQSYLALEFVEGIPLNAYCDEHRLDTVERLKLFLQVLSAVQYAHAQLVIHRDLKPSNVLVTPDGHVRLLDFGIAKLVTDGEARETELTQLGGRALTPDYASPEQIAGKPIGTASDVYSLGVLLYELLTGARPYRLKRDSRGALEDAIVAAEPSRPSTVVEKEAAFARRAAPTKLARILRGDLDTIVLKALKKNPSERYGTVEALARDVRNFLAGEPVLARPDSAVYRVRKFIARNRLAVGASCAVVIALVAASVISIWQARIAQREANRAIAVQGFLTDIFRTNSDTHPDPIKARQTTARELLDIGARRIDENFKDDPEGQAEVLDMLGEMYFDVGLDPEAADFYRRRVAALKRVFGDQDPRVAEALVTYGGQLEGLDREDEQLRALNEAKQILDRNGDYSSEQRALLLKSLSRAYSHSEAKGLQYAEEAVGIYRQYHAKGKGLPGALIRLGYARMWLGDNEEAETALHEALGLLEQDPNASVSGTITALLAIAEVQAKQSKITDAERNYRRALEKTLARNGPVHEDTLHVEARLGWFLHQTSRRAEGRRLLRDAVEKLNRGNYTPNVTDAVRTHFAYSLLADGQLDAAEPLVAQMVENDRRVAGGQSLLRAASLRAQAELWLLQGRYPESRSALDEAWSSLMKVLAPDGDPTLANALLLTRAQLEIAQGASASAIATLEQLKAPRDAAHLPIRVFEIRQLSLQAAADLQRDRVDESRRGAERALNAIAKSGLREYYQPLEAEVLLRLGQAKHRDGELPAARDDLERAMNLRLANEDEKSPFLAEAEIALAACLFDLGDRKEGDRLIKSARSREAASTKLGAQFRSPLLLVAAGLAARH